MPGDPFQANLTVGNPGPAVLVDVYVAVVLPAPAALLPTVIPGLLTLTWPASLPAGTYAFAVAFLRAGTLDLVAIASQGVAYIPDVGG